MLVSETSLLKKSNVEISDLVVNYTQLIKNFNLKIDATQLTEDESQIPDEYINFLDYQLCNTTVKSKESFFFFAYLTFTIEFSELSIL